MFGHVPGTVSDTARLMSKLGGQVRTEVRTRSRQKTSYLKLLRLFKFFSCPTADTKKFAGTSGFSGCPYPGGAWEGPAYQRLDRKGRVTPCSVLPVAKPTNNNSSSHLTLICLR